MAAFFLVIHWSAPLICLLINRWVLNRRLRWLPLFMISCVVTYLALLLVVASSLAKDAFARQGIDTGTVFSQGESSDAGLAMAPVLGVPLSLIWNAMNFAAFRAFNYVTGSQD